MTTRRELLFLGILAPLLNACGGGSSSSSGAGSATPYSNYADVERVVATTIPADDWATAAPESQGISRSAIQTLKTSAATISFLRSVLVVRNGVLVEEDYYNGAQSSDLLEVESVTKTVSSLLVGIALRDGKLGSISDTLRMLLPRELALVPNSVAGNITVQNILKMESGLAWDEDTQQNLLDTPNLTSVALGLPSDVSPQGTRWNYSTAVSHLLSPILADLYGMTEQEIATRYLFGPLGIKQSYWVTDATGENLGSYGLHLRTRDLMKIGWMSLQGGQWQGQSVVPSSWLATSQSNLVGLDLGSQGPLSHVGYGNLWWNGTLGGHQVILAWGYGGQFAILVPSLQMVVATNAKTEDLSVDAANNQETAILNLIAPFLASL